MKIGIFGGSFDPVHNGHIEIAKKALRQLRLDVLYFVPAFLPPHKTRKLTNVVYRKRMLRLAVKNYPKFKISDFEIKRKKIYTYQTLKYFRKKYKSAELYLIIGSDSAMDLKNWINVEEIKRLSKIVFAERKGYKVKIKKDLLKLEGIIKDTSSTDIREKIKKYFSIKKLVPPVVEKYIKKNGLYK
ncbi:MAG: nicotinate (nicotinamide) nucleotide adenylyltransferase [Elusimicrobia bacterium CG06_land_8_20_14_3_00_38_11]|nr:MAG: nicotinate (nicotinamide) nucleotide adenylyltransferase [Elusimicrobia bacterium CG06_land_8_20_14_3_00_38_11]